MQDRRQSVTTAGDISPHQAALLVVALGKELDTRSDVVYVSSDVLGNVVPMEGQSWHNLITQLVYLLVASHGHVARVHVLPFVVLGAKKAAELLCSQI